MAKKTAKDLDAEIAALQQRAAELRKSEAPGVIARIKEGMTYYGIFVEDLIAAGAPTRGGLKGASKRRGTGERQGFSDGVNTWSGYGPKPKWVKEALAAGKTMDDLRRSGPTHSERPARKRYSDGVHVWSGMGPKPSWLKQALAAGKALEDFIVKATD